MVIDYVSNICVQELNYESSISQLILLNNNKLMAKTDTGIIMLDLVLKNI